MVSKRIGVAALLSVLTLGNAAAARDLQGTRAMGMGGTLRAAATGPAGPLLNPAGMSLGRQYVISALYQFRASDSASQVHVSVVDSVTAKMAAGLYYSFVHATPEQSLALGSGDTFKLEEKLKTHEVGLSLSYPLGKIATIGFTSKYVNHSGELPEDAPEDVTTADVSRFTMDVGGIARLGNSIYLGVVGYNLIAVGDISFPRSLGMGLAFRSASFMAEFDTVLDFSSDPDDEVKPSYHGGIELALAKKYAVRTGVMHDTLRAATYVTGGFGLRSKTIVLSFGLRQMVDGGAETLVGFSAQLFLQ